MVKRASTDRLTVLDDLRLTGVQLGWIQEGEAMPRRMHTTLVAERGDEIEVSNIRAAHLITAGLAVPVKISKMGTAQRRLLKCLYVIIVEAPEHTLRVEPAPGRPEPIATDARDAVHRAPGGYAVWRRGEIKAACYWRVSRDILSTALRGLEQRGLALRDVPFGENRRAGRVQLTAAGKRAAEEEF